MSYNGTVRCQHCWERGHNRRGCPDLKKKMDERLAADPDDYRAKSYFEKKKGAKIRKCTFCKEQGHNRATCPNLKTAKTEWTVQNAAYRQEVLDHLTANGIGLGSLIDVPETYVGGSIGYLSDALGIVTAINWEAISVDGWGNYPPQALTVKACGNQTPDFNVSIPVDSSNMMKWSSRNNGLEALKSPCSGSHIVPPTGWTTGSVSKAKYKELFAGQTWGEAYDYDKREYVHGTCETTLNAKKFGEYCENQKKENEKNG